MATPALRAKELGNKAYKAKKFDEAINHYDDAIALDPTDITFHNNKGAVKFELGDYAGVIEVCSKAVDIESAKSDSDNKLIAKAQARLGKAYMKTDDLDKSMYHYDKAIFEHRAPDILRDRSEVQKMIKEKERVLYINPEISLEEKTKGNKKFKDGKYAEAIEFYSEAIKRNPTDHVLYSNRAACYTKLMEFGLGMHDCDKCIELAPDFIKGYLRKAALLRIDKPMEAKSCYERALAIDPTNAEARNGVTHCHQSLKDLPPYCNAGGGGERVLWQCVLALLDEFPAATIHIYTGDTDATPQQIISNAQQCFGLLIPLERVEFIFLKTRVLVEAKCYPVFTLLGQSLGSMVLGFEALCRFQPAYFVDSMGYAFTYFFAEMCGCDVISYVHYPTISTDMLGKVANREESFNNSSLVSRYALLSKLKHLYYHTFARLYSYMGSKSILVFVNSSWTRAHIDELWKVNERTFLLYPPCNTEKYLNISGSRSKRIVSVAQFRPEKDHALQIKSFALFVDKTARRDVTLTLVGGVRNEEDRGRVEKLRELSRSMGLEDLVEFKVSISYDELYQILSDSLIGLHTMENEHFGISVVELQAAGIIAVAHNSGGPKLDIVAPGTGFLAATEEAYSDNMIRVLEMDEEEREDIRVRARQHVKETFSDSSFRDHFISHCLAQAYVDLSHIEEVSEEQISEEEFSEEEFSEEDFIDEEGEQIIE